MKFWWQCEDGNMRMAGWEQQHEDGCIRLAAARWWHHNCDVMMVVLNFYWIVSYTVCLSFFQLIWKRVSSFNIFFADHLYATIKVQRQCEDASMRRAGWGWQHKDGCIRRAASGWLPQDCDVRTAASGQRYDDSSIRMVALEWLHQDSCIRTVVSGWCCQEDRLLKKNYLSLTIYVFFLSLSKKE